MLWRGGRRWVWERGRSGIVASVSAASLGKSVSLSGPQFAHLSSGDNGTDLVGLARRLNKEVRAQCLAWCLAPYLRNAGPSSSPLHAGPHAPVQKPVWSALMFLSYLLCYSLEHCSHIIILINAYFTLTYSSVTYYSLSAYCVPALSKAPHRHHTMFKAQCVMSAGTLAT